MSTSHRNRLDVPSWRHLRENPGRIAVAPVQFVGFWSAVVLPLVLVPMLLTGFASSSPIPFAAILIANVLAAVAGRNHRSG